MHNEQLLTTFFHIGAIKFGSYVLKSGMTSPIYVDLRSIVSYPDLLKEITDLIWSRISHLQADCLCGVPYTALPIAAALSITYRIPMILKRKEAKDYGTKRWVEGAFKPGDRCVVIDDILTTGTSILETIYALEQEGLHVNDVLILIDREQGGKKILESKGYQVQALFKLKEMVAALGSMQLVHGNTIQNTLEFLNTVAAPI